jgi:DNA-binding transcriptional MerR regulator
MGSHQPIRKTVVPEPVAIPDKLYFRIGDVARLCQVAPYVLRFWETEFPQLKPNKGGTGQRLYRKKEVEIALRIKSLLYDQGYTIAGARQIFKSDNQSLAVVEPASPLAPRPVLHRDPEPSADPHDRGAELRLRAQLADLRDEMQAVIALLSQSHGSAATAAPCQPDPVPTPRPRPRLVLEPKPKSVPQTTLHLTSQGDLFSAE